MWARAFCSGVSSTSGSGSGSFFFGAAASSAPAPGAWMLTPMSMPITCSTRWSCRCLAAAQEGASERAPAAARAREGALVDRLRITLELLQLGHERRIHEKAGGLRVAGDFLEQVRPREEVTQPVLRPTAAAAAAAPLGLGLGVVEALDQHGEPGLHLEPRLVGGDGVGELAHPVQRSALATVAL